MSKKIKIIIGVIVVIVALFGAYRAYIMLGPGKAAGYYLQGEELYFADRYAEAVECFKKGAEGGDDGAQYYLGRCYFDGTGIEKNYEEAAKWFQESAEQGNWDAMYYLGNCYFEGLGVTKNVEEATKWYEKQAEVYAPYGLDDLAHAYAYGKGVAKSKEMAIKTIDDAINKSPGDREKLLDTKGEILYVFGDKEGAKQLFIEVLTKGEKHWYDNNDTKLKEFMQNDNVWTIDDNAFVILAN